MSCRYFYYIASLLSKIISFSNAGTVVSQKLYNYGAKYKEGLAVELFNSLSIKMNNLLSVQKAFTISILW